jgi:hypothetical protein
MAQQPPAWMAALVDVVAECLDAHSGFPRNYSLRVGTLFPLRLESSFFNSEHSLCYTLQLAFR